MKRNNTAIALSHACVLTLALAACGDDSKKGAGDASDATDVTDATDATDSNDASDVDATDASDDSATDVVPDTANDGDAGEVTPESALEATADAFCPGYAERWCAAASGDCGCDAAPGFPAGADCLASFVARCRSDLATYLSAVQSGQGTFQPEAAAACLDTLAPLLGACTMMPNDLFFVACPILMPTGGFDFLPGEGEACQSYCAAGTRCGSDAICHVPGGVGADCTGLQDCAPELICDGGSASGTSVGKCAVPTFADSGEACSSDADCKDYTTCRASSHKVCVAKSAGQACVYDDGCIAGEYCVTPDGAATGTCTPVPGDGQPCGHGTYCAEGLGCDAVSGNCAALPGDGEPCALGSTGPWLCAADLGCHDGVCGPLPTVDEPCAQGEPACAEGLGCAFGPEGSFCRVPAGAGTYCENDPPCGPGFFCDYSKNECAADQPIGALCRNGNECGAGVCLPDATFTFRCAAQPGLGGACYIDECAGDLACQSPYTQGACVPSVICGTLGF